MHPEGLPSGGPESPNDDCFDLLGRAFDYPPELNREVGRLMDGVVINKAESRKWLKLAGRAIAENNQPAEIFYLMHSNYYDEQAERWRSIAENLIAAHNRKQRIGRAGAKVAGIIRKPLGVLAGLRHDAAAETFVPGIEDGRLAGS